VPVSRRAAAFCTDSKTLYRWQSLARYGGARPASDWRPIRSFYARLTTENVDFANENENWNEKWPVLERKTETEMKLTNVVKLRRCFHEWSKNWDRN